jgi:hypothetical protein
MPLHTSAKSLTDGGSGEPVSMPEMKVPSFGARPTAQKKAPGL